MNFLSWVNQNSTVWMANPEIEQTEESNSSLISVIALSSIAIVGLFYCLTRTSGADQERVLRVSRKILPEELLTPDNLNALSADRKKCS